DITGNAATICEQIEAAAEQGADLVVFPELAVAGYPPKDLLLKPDFVHRCEEAVQEIARSCTATTAIVGYPCPSDSERGRQLYNAVAVCADGKIVTRHVKSLLPTYDVFDERRYFEPGEPTDMCEIAGVTVGISICEDLWNDSELFPHQLYHDNPIDQLAEAGAQLFVNCAASPFETEKPAFRERLATHTARKHGLPMVMVSQVGGNDELVFDGHSMAIDGEGKLIGRARGFETDLLVVDVPVGEPTGEPGRIEPVVEGSAAIYRALVLGLKDYCRKCGFSSVVIGLSGGIDSAVTAALCVAALGPENVRGVTMPSRYSSGGSVDDSMALAENLGIRCDEVPIEPAHAAFEQMLEPVFEGREPGVAEENIQARARGVVLMALSNKFGSLLVTTGNKSELAVGYCTLYGDMAGGLAILSDVPKTDVYRLARWINEAEDSPLRQQFDGPVIPADTVTKPPSAELRPDQKDQDSLPDYDVLDEIIERYVQRHQSAAQIIEHTGFDESTVLRIVRLIDVNEYKRKQAAPGLKVTSKAFGFGRRMPIAQRYEHAAAEGFEASLKQVDPDRPQGA
ncbi:MAG: NAD+ synthase, partial [Phycisphaeraceae bacterium]|nr:NAD+ synthase [Phycisphaeraceae bacterium]